MMRVAICLATWALAGTAAAGPTRAATALAEVHLIDADGIGRPIGTLSFRDSREGLIIRPRLAGLPPGPHGFHVHQNASCGPGLQDGRKIAGLAAGGHFDPEKTGQHRGPGAMDGHKGDLPRLEVDQGGKAMRAILAPRLKLAEIRGHALVIQAGGDNFADIPAPLGGGGTRIACAVVR